MNIYKGQLRKLRAIKLIQPLHTYVEWNGDPAYCEEGNIKAEFDFGYGSFTATVPPNGFTPKEEQEVIAILSSFRVKQ